MPLSITEMPGNFITVVNTESGMITEVASPIQEAQLVEFANSLVPVGDGSVTVSADEENTIEIRQDGLFAAPKLSSNQW